MSDTPQPTHWLLLRGLAREMRHWGSFPELLERTLDEGLPDGEAEPRVHLLDLPGMGTEYWRPSPQTIDEIVDDLRRRWQGLSQGKSGTWGLASVSLGGMVAMNWCARYPEDFGRLVLMNTSASDLSKPWQRMQPRFLPRLLLVPLLPKPEWRERLVLGGLVNMHPGIDAVASQWGEIARVNPQMVRTTLSQLKAALGFHMPARIEVPTLVLIGEGDKLARPICGRQVAEHLGAEVQTHPKAGHDLTLDAPEWVATQIRDWVR